MIKKVKRVSKIVSYRGDIYDRIKSLELENEKIINQNKELENKLKMNEIELNACYNVIKEIISKNEKIEIRIENYLILRYNCSNK